MTPILVIQLCALTQTPGSPTVDEIRRAMKEAVDAVRTAQVVYLSDESNTGPSPEEGALLRSAYRKYPDQLPGAARLAELNKVSRRERISLNLDAIAGVWRLTIEDLRDIEGLMAAEGIPRERRGFLDRSSVVLASNDISASLATGIPFLIVQDRRQERAAPPVLQSGLPLGVIWDEQFQRAAGTAIAPCASQGQRLLCVTLEEAGGGRKVLEVDPEVGYRLRSLKIYSPGGTLVVAVIADDYRLKDGVRLPFVWEQVEYDSTGNVKRRQKKTIQEARFNQELARGASRLVVPAGTRVSGPPGRADAVIQEEQVMEITELRTLFGAPPGATSQSATTTN